MGQLIMILFFGPYPSPENERDGMVQRVAAIDNLVADTHREYVSASYRRHWKLVSEKRGVVTIHRVNFFLHWFFILKLIVAAEWVYVHSVFNVLFALPAYLLKKQIVTDVHGVVPEETRAQGKPVRAVIRSICERLAAYKSTVLVCVTQRMADHLSKKYPGSSQQLILPIFDMGMVQDKWGEFVAPVKSRATIIYAGGLQVWQNIDLMLCFASDNPEYEYIFLTPNPDALRLKAENYGGIDADFSTCPHQQIGEYYRRVEFGFLLRDDNVINNVACPTKAVEYMAHGVIPVVLNMNIGDFSRLGASFLLLDEMSSPPEPATIFAMRKANFECLRRLTEQYRKGSTMLIHYLT
ncbi:hypothetical protein [Ralstonia sp. Ralssp110]|uniref:hypothetical protein n=1 Tax=Ralstonia sp. Ralssp110 TaxID=3243004 RepID=UPI0039B52BEB